MRRRPTNEDLDRQRQADNDMTIVVVGCVIVFWLLVAAGGCCACIQ